MRLPPIDHIKRTRDQYAALGYSPYSWVHNPQAPPLQPLAKPISHSKLGVISSGGVYASGQIAFHFKDDTSLRVISTDASVSQLRATHFAYDLTDARNDPNVVLPLDALKAQVTLGALGELSAHAYTFMGGIYSARKVRELIAPEIIRRLREDAVDIALMVPV